MINSTIGLILVLSAAAAQMPGEPAPDLPIPREIARCESPAGFNQAVQNLSAGLSDESIYRQVPGEINGELLLVRIEDDLDIIHLIDGVVLWSARRNNAQITDTGTDTPAYHMVIDSPEGREHLLFAVADDGVGQMIWSNMESSVITDCYPGQPVFSTPAPALEHYIPGQHW